MHQQTTPAETSGLGWFEHRGVERIPEHERIYTPWTFARLYLGGSFALGSILWGWLPITLGLGVTDAITSITAGTLVGLLVIWPLVLIGTKTATNNATSSGAFFGVRGRLLGSGLGLLLMLFTAALAIWTAGGILVEVAGRLFGTPTGDGALALAYAVLTGLSVAIAVWGYHLLVKVTTLLFVGGVVFAVLMVVAFAGNIDLGYAGGQYALGSWGRTWLLSALAFGVGGVMTLATVVGDWSRYVPADKYPARRMLPLPLTAIAFGFVVPPAIGAAVTSAFVDPFAPWPVSLVAGAPGWFVIVLLVMASIGGLGFSAPTIYSTGLDLDTVAGPRLTRATATWIMGAATIVLVLVGSLVWDANESLTAASLILLALTAPWAAIVGIGHIRCRGRYRDDDLQVFNRGQRGVGIYWFTGGWNWRAVLAWTAGAVFGVTTVTAPPLYTGPFAGVAMGIDVSFFGAFLVAGISYLILEAVPIFGGRPAVRPAPIQGPEA